MAPQAKPETMKVKAATPRPVRNAPWQTQQNGGPARSVAQQLDPARLEAIATRSQELAAHVGDRVTITNILSQSFTGTIYSCDSELVLETGPTDYHLILVAKILSHKYMSNESGPVCIASEERGRQKQTPGSPVRPDGVSDVGYGLHHSLGKTLQVRWQGKSIVVMDAVRVDPPYDVDTCKAVLEKHAKQLERVKVLVKNELLKLEMDGVVERRGG